MLSTKRRMSIFQALMMSGYLFRRLLLPSFLLLYGGAAAATATAEKSSNYYHRHIEEEQQVSLSPPHDPTAEAGHLLQCSREIQNVQSCIVKDSCSEKSIDDCIKYVARTTTDKSSLQEIGQAAQDCFENQYLLTKEHEDCPLVDDDNCVLDSLPSAIECIVLNMIDDCLYTTQTSFLECTSANSKCNYYDCHAIKYNYWDDPRGYGSLNSIIDRADNDFIAIDLCPAIDHSWVQPLCHITTECCDSCTLEINPLLNCMIDNIVMKTIVNNDVDDDNHCFGEITDDVCHDGHYIDTGDSHRSRRNMEQQNTNNDRNLGGGGGESPLLKTDLDLNSTTTTEYLQYCGRKFALNIALMGEPSLAINEHMICLLEVAASKTFVDNKVPSVSPFVRKEDEPYWINGILWSVFIIGIVAVVVVIGFGLLLHELCSGIKQTWNDRKKRYQQVGAFGTDDDDEDEGEEGHFFETVSSGSSSFSSTSSSLGKNKWNTVRRDEPSPKIASNGGGGGGGGKAEREPVRLSALL